MATRLFKFKLLTQVQLERFETDARTYAELVAAIEADPIMSTKISFRKQRINEDGKDYDVSVKLIEKVTLVEYGDIPEATLPAGEALFFVTPTKTKAGAIDVLTTEELQEMGYKELRTLGAYLNREYNAGLSLHDKREDILWRIDAWYDNLTVDDTPEDGEMTEAETNVEILSMAMALIQDVIDNMADCDYIDGVTHEELHEKALSLQQQLSKEV